MKTLFLVQIILMFFIGCNSVNLKNNILGLDPNSLPKNGLDSKIIDFKRTAIMDTITAIIEGKIIPLTGMDTLAFAEIELLGSQHSYKSSSDLFGHFKFSHIYSGTYKINASYLFYRRLHSDSIHLGSGDISTLIIGMGHFGQDDLKQYSKRGSRHSH